MFYLTDMHLITASLEYLILTLRKQCTFSLEKNSPEVLTLDLKQAAIVE